MASLENDVRQFLTRHRFRLNTDLGQHFLIDEDVLHTIVDTAGIEKEDHIVEIGPGIGVLTRELLKYAGKVTVIEIDNRMIPLLQKFVGGGTFLPYEFFPHTGQRPAHHLSCNFLQNRRKYSLSHHLSPAPPCVSGVKTIPQSTTLLIQREVAEKIVDTENAGILTILIALFGTPILTTTVKPSAFLPPPKVDSAILHIESHKKPLANPETIEKLLRLVKIAFAGKRKMLRNTLGSFHGGMELLSAASVAADRRPQTLSVEEWITLAQKAP